MDGLGTIGDIVYELRITDIETERHLDFEYTSVTVYSFYFISRLMISSVVFDLRHQLGADKMGSFLTCVLGG